jgi:uncharacterized protein (DUF362 family)
MNSPLQTQNAAPATKIDRRTLLAGASVAAAGAIGLPIARRIWAEKQPVFLVGGQKYDTAALQATILDGLAAVGFDLAALRGRNVLLKPNLVEPRRDAPHMTTHPAVIVAAAEVFRRHGAKVRVGEAPGHVRDTQMALAESGVGEALETAGLEFVDLNYDDVAAVPNRGGHSKLEEIFFPASVLEADLIVSLPKLKTHHWVGMTAAMKNLFGLLPGIKYGWPKNVLHHAGIPQTVVDIHASAPPTIAVVDAIDCMEGDGPIMGSLKPLGVIAVGANLTALDATCARLMGLKPELIGYLDLAADVLGPVADWQIEQRGEPWEKLHSPFTILDVPHLQRLRDTSGVLVS